MLTAFVLLVAFLVGAVSSYLHWINIGKLNRRNLSIFSVLLILIYSTLGVLTWMEVLDPEIIELAAMILYTLATGLFIGGGAGLIKLRLSAGYPEYAQPNFLTDGLPNFLAVVIVAYGIYRSSIMTPMQISWLTVTSGLSLVGFGFYGWCIEVVPEFREKGIILLDQFIPWEDVVSYHWDSEEVITIEYHTDGSSTLLSEFHTAIPPENRRDIERLLKTKIEEFGSTEPDKEEAKVNSSSASMN